MTNIFSEKKAIIGIVGLGYVGLPLLLRFAEQGFKVIGFDIDKSKIDKLNKGESYIKYAGVERIVLAHQKNQFIATNDFSKAKDADALIICVPTPLNKHHEPDLSFIITTIETLLPYLHKGQLISLESTTYPGTTDEELKPRIESRGFVIGNDIYLVFSPEREDPGNMNYSIRNIPKIVGGITDKCLEAGIAMYKEIVDKVIPVSSAKVAEMTKLLENIFRSVNIGLVNELKMVTDKMGLNIWEIIDAASTKPFGFAPFYPGPGLGGHCIPIDPFYLTWKAKEFGIHTRFIELAGEINTQMPQYVVEKIAEALNERKKSINGSKILLLGLSYKKNIDDPRESASAKLMELLINKGAVLQYSDPFIPVFPGMRKYKSALKSVSITKGILMAADCVLIATDHDDFDYDLIAQHSELIVDTRGRYKKEMPNLVRS
jgi:UDP-N-acetyl-D-glucosamine dehydrogenase